MNIFTLCTVAVSAGEEDCNCAWICIRWYLRTLVHSCKWFILRISINLDSTTFSCYFFSVSFQREHERERNAPIYHVQFYDLPISYNIQYSKLVNVDELVRCRFISCKYLCSVQYELFINSYSILCNPFFFLSAVLSLCIHYNRYWACLFLKRYYLLTICNRSIQCI